MRVLWLLIFDYTWNSPTSTLAFSFCRNLDFTAWFTPSINVSTGSCVNFGQGRGSSETSDRGTFCVSVQSYNQNSATGQYKCLLCRNLNFIACFTPSRELSTYSDINFGQGHGSSQITYQGNFSISEQSSGQNSATEQ